MLIYLSIKGTPLLCSLHCTKILGRCLVENLPYFGVSNSFSDLGSLCWECVGEYNFSFQGNFRAFTNFLQPIHAPHFKDSWCRVTIMVSKWGRQIEMGYCKKTESHLFLILCFSESHSDPLQKNRFLSEMSLGNKVILSLFNSLSSLTLEIHNTK